MSTPSTAAVLPPPNPYYNSHHNHLLGAHPHLTNGHSYTASSASSVAITKGISNIQVSQPSPTMGSRPVEPAQSSRGRPRKTIDWSEYFKNGVPKEIIVIDDSPPPSTSNKRPAPSSARAVPTSQLSLHGLSNIPRHADKKRRTSNYNAYEPVYPASHYSPLAAGHQSPAGTVSSSTAGRNSSTLISTAPTSAGSSGVASSSSLAYPASNGTNGTKRKRMTRSTAAAAVAAASGDAYLSYHPPPKPPIKAKEVFVKTIQDVSIIFHKALSERRKPF